MSWFHSWAFEPDLKREKKGMFSCIISTLSFSQNLPLDIQSLWAVEVPMWHFSEMLWKSVLNIFISGFWQHCLPTHQLPHSICSHQGKRHSACGMRWPRVADTLFCLADIVCVCVCFSHQLQNSLTTHTQDSHLSYCSLATKWIMQILRHSDFQRRKMAL